MHISPHDLGDKLGVSFQQDQKFEKGVMARCGSTASGRRCVGYQHRSLYGDLGNGKIAKPSKLTAFSGYQRRVWIPLRH